MTKLRKLPRKVRVALKVARVRGFKALPDVDDILALGSASAFVCAGYSISATVGLVVLGAGLGAAAIAIGREGTPREQHPLEDE